ncbi:MAG: PQQ-binding-like beta-propeller repeat protein [bacterium]
MKMRFYLKNQRGALFILMLAIVMVFLIAGVLLITVVTTDVKISARHRHSTVAFYIAEAGLAKALVSMGGGFSLDEPLLGTLNGGSFSVSFSPEPGGRIMLISVGTFRDAQRTVKVEVFMGGWPMFKFGPERKASTPQAILTPLVPTWSYDTGSPIYSSPVVSGSVVYFGCDDGNVYAINALTGDFIGTFSIGSRITATPAVDAGVLYVGAWDGYMYAIDVATGEEKWAKADPINPAPIQSSVGVINGVIYYGCDNGKVYALNAETGDLLSGWPYTTGGAVVGSPAIYNGTVYIGSLDGKMYALDAVTGQPKSGWPATTGGEIHSTPGCENGRIYFGSDDTYMYAYDESGSRLSRVKVQGDLHSSPAVLNDWIYFGSGFKKVHAFSWTGSKLKNEWRYNGQDAVFSSPALTSNIAVVGCENGWVFALDLYSRDLRDKHATGGPVTASPAIFADNIYATSTDGNLYCYKGTEALPGPIQLVNYTWLDRQ